MSLDIDTLKRRRNLMVAVNAAAAVVAVAAIVGFLKFEMAWAGIAFIAVGIVAAQIARIQSEQENLPCKS